MIRSVFRAPRNMVIGTLILGVFVVFAASFATPVKAVAGINEQINFQGRLLTSEGAAAPDGYYNVQFKIYQDGDGQSANNSTGSPASSLKWTENWLNNDGNGVEVRNGYFSVELGSVNAFGSQVDWNQSVLWLSVNIGDTNGTCTPFTSCNPDGEMLPMKRLGANPYAMNAGKLGGITAAGFIQSTTTPQTANISVQSANAADVTATIQGAAGQTANILEVTADSVATPLLEVSAAGSVTITPTSDASPALTVNSTSGNILSAGATQIALNQDTVVGTGKTFTTNGSGFDGSGNLGLGTVTPGKTLDIAVNDVATDGVPVRISQQGGGDNGIEYATNGQSSYYTGVDATDGAFKISSSTAAGATSIEGYSTIGSMTDGSNYQTTEAMQVTASQTGVVQSLSTYFGTVDHFCTGVDMGIYADTGSNAPGTLLGSTGVFDPTDDSWNTRPLTDTVNVTSGVKYWLAVANDCDNDMRYSSGSNLTAFDGAPNSVPLATNFGTPDSTSAFQLSIYMTLNTSGSLSDVFDTGTIFSLSATGALTSKNSTNSTTAFQVQNAAGTGIFTVDTTNNKVVAATYDATSGYSINGTAGAGISCSAGEYLDNAVVQGGIVTSGTCTTAAAGGGSYRHATGHHPRHPGCWQLQY